ncbi:hypothetical protein LXA43DRAFT_1060778 [Ganoderma leucocontextum]|nr:hypothetical protein LXA43DRAFT_1060778 [Ganoderma leucocontextum]
MPNNPPTSSILVPELTSSTAQPTPTPSSVDWRLPFNYPSLISSSQSFSDSPPSLTVSPASPGSRAASTNTGAIAGGVIGGVALLALLAASAFILIRHRRKSRPPPSAEFMHLARGASELGFATMDGKTSPTLHRLIPLARQSSLEDEPEERPLEFVPEGYRDPVLEKAQESAAMREKYSRSEEGGYQ